MTDSPLAALADPTLLKTDALVGGEWVAGSARFAVVDPATGAPLADVANLGPVDCHHAITAADKAFGPWRGRTAKERAAVLMKWFALVQQHAEDLARILTAEQGKPITDSRAEVAHGASYVEWFAEEARRIYGETIPANDPNKRFVVIRQPIGVCAAITPWNLPLAAITRKVAPALAAGCPVVVKPSDSTPLTALALAELAQRAGMPSGVLNVVTADAANSIEVGLVLSSSDIVRHLSFTGSTEVGRLLMRQCAPTVKKLGLELGGQAPFIVFDDADLDSAVDGAIAARFGNAGQACAGANRFYVQAGIHDAFVAALAERARTLKVGNGFEPGVAIGPLIDDEAIANVESLVAEALAKGARLVVGGERLGERFYPATVLADVDAEMQCAKGETPGPLAPVLRFTTEAEAITLANASEYGLASYFYSRDIGRIFRVAEALECGMVGVNTASIAAAEVPFGGIKQSGRGREGARQGIDDYVETKLVCLSDILK